MNKWDSRYSTKDFAYGTEPNDFLKSSVQKLRPGKILCLAEGEGRNAVFLAQLGFEVTAVDSSGVGLDKAAGLAADHGVHLHTIVADLETFIIQPDGWDGIVSIFCHLPPELRKKVHKQVVGGLRRGGVLLLEAYTPDQLALGTGGPPDRNMMMTLSALQGELTGLEFVHGREKIRNIEEGRLHTGKGAVVQVVAVKS